LRIHYPGDSWKCPEVKPKPTRKHNLVRTELSKSLNQ
jgi:hypothetical protein